MIHADPEGARVPRGSWFSQSFSLTRDEGIGQVDAPVVHEPRVPSDQVGSPLQLVRIRNAGSAFGLAQGLWLWTAVAMLGIALVPVFFRRSSNPTMLIGASLPSGGGLANLTDRLFTGGVTNFIRPGGPIIMKVADVALLFGTIAMSVAMAVEPRAR